MKHKNLLFFAALCCALMSAWVPAQAQQAGKDFWVTFLQADQTANNELSLSLILSAEKSSNVLIENIYTGYREEIQIPAGQSQQVSLYSGVVLMDYAREEMERSGKVCYAGFSEQTDSCAIHICSTEPVSVEAVNYKKATFDATGVLPTRLLRNEYYIQTYTPSDHSGAASSQGSHFAIIAAEDNTIVDITPTVPTAGGKQAGETFATGLLMRGQVYYVWSAEKDNEAADLSGTHVKARDGKPIAVFQGCPHTNIPYQIKQRDHLFSQAMPVQFWGDSFVLTTSKERPADIVRVMALEDGTEIFINGEPVHTFDFTTDTKHYWECTIGAQGTYAQSGSCLLTSSKPCDANLFITSQQFYGDRDSEGDPAMLHLNSTKEQISSVAFSTIESVNGTMTQYLNIVTKQPATMLLDGVSIADSFQPVSGTSDESYGQQYYYAQVSLGTTSATHVLNNTDGTFTARLYGYSSNESYGLALVGDLDFAEPTCILASGTCGENLTWNLNCDSVLVIRGTGAMTDYYSYEDIPWYDYIFAIKAVIISDEVTHIGHYAFRNCRNMTFAYIGNSVRSIGGGAFSYCDKLSSVNIPAGVHQLGDGVFEGCAAISAFDVEADNSYYCAVDGVLFDKEMTTLIQYPAANPRSAYTIPEGVTTIGECAFWCSRNLTFVDISNSVTTIKSVAFLGCDKLTSITIPAGVKNIESAAFISCYSLISVTDYATSPQYLMWSDIFESATYLYGTLYVPAESLEAYQNAGVWQNFKHIVPIGSESPDCIIASGACNGTPTWVLTCDSALTVNGAGNLFACDPWYSDPQLIKSVEIGDDVTGIERSTFKDCINLTKVTIGKSITALGRSVFNGSTKIKEVQWNAVNYRQEKPNHDENCFPFFSSRDSITSFVFGEEVEYIPAYLMKDFAAIDQLIIPASVTEIGEFAFANDYTISQITCQAQTPPTVASTTFAGMNTSECILYVPYSAVDLYKETDGWKEFFNIQPILAEEVPETITDVETQPQDNSVIVTWPVVAGADIYTLEIKKNGELICILTFNANGQLIGIAFAPSRDGNHAPAAVMTANGGLRFTVTGLDAGTHYNLKVIAKDAGNETLVSYQTSFTTTGDPATALKQITNDKCQMTNKLLRNGQLYLMYKGKIYNVQGAEVR